MHTFLMNTQFSTTRLEWIKPMLLPDVVPCVQPIRLQQSVVYPWLNMGRNTGSIAFLGITHYSIVVGNDVATHQEVQTYCCNKVLA